LDALRALDWAPRAVRQRAREIRGVRRDLEAELGRAPAIDEIAARLGMSAVDLAALTQRIRRAALVSLDEQVSLSQTLADDRSDVAGTLEHEEARRALAAAVEELPAQQRRVIMRYTSTVGR